MRKRGNEAPIVIGPRQLVQLIGQTASLIRKRLRRSA